MLRGLFFLFISIQIVSIGSAEVVEKYCIQNMENILQYIPEKEKTLFVFSWDLSVSANLGQEDPLLEKQKTSRILHSIGKKGAKIIVLASRLDGASKNYTRDDYTRPKIEDTISRMVQDMKNQDFGLEEYGDLADTGYWEFPIPQAESNVMTQDNVIFAGAPHNESAKGWVVKLLIDKDRLKEKPDVILFIDRDAQHLPSFEKAFAGRPEKVTLFHYPHGDACEKGYKN